MYTNFWYPICTAAELGQDAPLRAELLGLRFVAFRDAAGQARVLSDTCVHRGGSLGRGKLAGDAVACPYHGWEFGGDGRCTRIPTLQEGRPPARAKVDSYPVQEAYGIVFAFLGDLPEAERPPLCPVPEFGQPGWRASEPVILDIGCYYERSVENGLDPAHNQFVHPGQGFPPMLTETFELHDEAWGARFWMNFGDPVLEMTEFARERNRTGELRAGSWFHGPNALVTSIFINADSNMVQYFFEAPVSARRTRIYFVSMRNCMLEPELDEKIRAVNLRIAGEDIAVLEELLPARTPVSPARELMTPADQVILRYRERLRDWTARGWQIDQRAMREAGDEEAWAIPGPARRDSGNWVMPAVPRVPAATPAVRRA